MTRREKERDLAELEERFKKARSIILADFRGLTVAEISRLRRLAREARVEFRVVKNTLAGIATKRAGVDGLERFLTGPTGVALGYDDPVAPAKVLDRFGRETRELPFKGGYVEGQALDAGEVKALAALPGRIELVGRLLGALEAPVAGLARVLAGNVRGLAVALSRIAEAKGAG